MNIVFFNTKNQTVFMLNANTYTSHGIIWTTNALNLNLKKKKIN